MKEKIQELEEIKKTLDDNSEEMENFEEYQKVYATVTQLLKLLPSIFVFMDKLEEELNKTKKAN